MNQILKIMSLITVLLALGSCTINRVYDDYKKNIPKKSFIKLEKDIIVRTCADEMCVERDFGSVASGVVIENRLDGAYVLTVAHVCDLSDVIAKISTMPNTTYDIAFNAVTIDLRKKPVQIVKFNNKHDICLLWVDNLLMPAAPISTQSPEAGDVVLNLAAPLGVHSRDMVPMFKGFFNGTDKKGTAFYSLPSFPGSSGSPIFNTKGEIVGVIHSTIRHFHNISLSPNYYFMVEFINETIEKDFPNRIMQKIIRPFLDLEIKF
jgi:S1-C subfamily serine protease